MSSWLTGRSAAARRRQIEHLSWLRKHDPLYRAQSEAMIYRSKIRVRWSAIKAYDGRCECCKEKRPQFLCIDHIEGGGNKHRLGGLRGDVFYRWLRRNNYPPGYRVLCHNCNFSVWAYGRCPHSDKVGGAIDAERIMGKNELPIPSAAGRRSRGNTMAKFAATKGKQSR